jgi:hypothetical protein
VFALGGEEVSPGNDLGVLLEQRAALTLGHPTPDAELDAIVERIRATLQDHRAVSADHGGFALGGSADEQLIGVGLSTSGLGNPRNAGLGLCAVDQGAG